MTPEPTHVFSIHPLIFSFTLSLNENTTVLTGFLLSLQQVTITDGGDASVPPGVSIPGAYSANDPGILINIWTGDIDNYVVPGPDVVCV